jgi:hypothetical protein
MAGEKETRSIPRDRYAEVLVVVMVALALLVAWGVKAGAESRAVQIELATLRVRYGYDWIREQPTSPEVLKIVDPGSGARFQTTIVVSELTGMSANDQVAQLLNSSRLRERSFYQVLDGGTIEWRGRETYRNSFAYVDVSPDLLNPTVPVVVHGIDYVFQHGSTTFVITCLADEGVYDDALVQFERFLNSFTPV